MGDWKKVYTGWAGHYYQEKEKSTVEFLGLREKRHKKAFDEVLEDGDRIYFYHNNKRVLDGTYHRPVGSVKNSWLSVPAYQDRPEMVLSYENLKLFCKNSFELMIYRKLEKSPFAHYPKIVNGVETPLVPY